MDLTAHLKDYRAKVAASALPGCTEHSKRMMFGSQAGFTTLSAAMRAAESAATSGYEDRYLTELRLHAEGMVMLLSNMVAARLGFMPEPLDLVKLLSEPDGWKWFKFSRHSVAIDLSGGMVDIVMVYPRYCQPFMGLNYGRKTPTSTVIDIDADEVPLITKKFMQWKMLAGMEKGFPDGRAVSVSDLNRHGRIDDWSLPMRWN